MHHPSNSCDFHGAIKCATVLALGKFFASQNVAKESQCGSVCAHAALPLLRTLFPDAMRCRSHQTVATSVGRSSVQLFLLLESSLPHKMLPKSPSVALSVPTLRCRCFALCFLMACDVRPLTQLRLPWGDQVCNCSRSW